METGDKEMDGEGEKYGQVMGSPAIQFLSASNDKLGAVWWWCF